jgi:predicted metal-dependent peptidase
MMFSIQEPYYGIILASMNRHATDKLDTLGVARTGKVFMLAYNPEYLNKLPTFTIMQLLKHECMHIAFNHFTMWETETQDEWEHHIRNIAEDLEINSYLDRDQIVKEAGGVFAEDFGWDKGLGTREYYKLLKQKFPQPPPSFNPNFGIGGGGFGDTFDDHSMWPKDMSDAEKEILQQIVDEMAAFAADEVEKGRGTIPGEMVGRIELLRNKKKPRPVADWKRYFRRYVGNEFTDQIRKSKKRMSKRFPDAAGNCHRRKARILVGIDTSGSVSMPEYREFFGQINTLVDTTNFHVLECDARIQYEYEYKRKPNETLHGGGGTDFQPVINYFIEHRKEYEALIYFTDGGAPIPQNTPKNTLWLVSSKGDKNAARYKVNGAKVLFIAPLEEN